MTYTPEQLLEMPDAERDAIAAEVCMGWRIEKDWQPSQPHLQAAASD